MTPDVTADAKKVLVVDDHPSVRLGLRGALAREPGFEVSAEAATPAEALAAMEREVPDMAIIDLILEDESGLDLVEVIHGRWPDLPMLVFSIKDQRLFARRALALGARGYLSKNVHTSEIVNAVRKVASGEVYVDRTVAAQLIQSRVRGEGLSEDPVEAQLTEREREIFELIGHGSSGREIADELEISPKTVETHKANIKTKLGIANASQLIERAVLWRHRDD